MKVKLTRSWFTPDGRLLKPGIHEVPDDWNMPTGVEEIVEEPQPKKAAK